VEAVILAGGLGLRLRPLTNDKPKPMVVVKGSPIAEYQIEWLRKNGICFVTFACGYRHEKIREYFGDGKDFGVNVRYSIEGEPAGTGGAIRRAMSMTHENPVVVVNGDVLTDLNLSDLIAWHKNHCFVASIVAVPLVCPYGVLDIWEGSDMVFGFREKPVFPDIWVNAGIYVMEKSVTTYLPEKGDVEEEVFPELARRGVLGVYRSTAWWKAIDTVKDLLRLEEELRLTPRLRVL